MATNIFCQLLFSVMLALVAASSCAAAINCTSFRFVGSKLNNRSTVLSASAIAAWSDPVDLTASNGKVTNYTSFSFRVNISVHIAPCAGCPPNHNVTASDFVYNCLAASWKFSDGHVMDDPAIIVHPFSSTLSAAWFRVHISHSFDLSRVAGFHQGNISSLKAAFFLWNTATNASVLPSSNSESKNSSIQTTSHGHRYHQNSSSSVNISVSAFSYHSELHRPLSFSKFYSPFQIYDAYHNTNSGQPAGVLLVTLRREAVNWTEVDGWVGRLFSTGNPNGPDAVTYPNWQSARPIFGPVIHVGNGSSGDGVCPQPPSSPPNAYVCVHVNTSQQVDLTQVFSRLEMHQLNPSTQFAYVNSYPDERTTTSHNKANKGRIQPHRLPVKDASKDASRRPPPPPRLGAGYCDHSLGLHGIGLQGSVNCTSEFSAVGDEQFLQIFSDAEAELGIDVHLLIFKNTKRHASVEVQGAISASVTPSITTLNENRPKNSTVYNFPSLNLFDWRRGCFELDAFDEKIPIPCVTFAGEWPILYEYRVIATAAISVNFTVLNFKATASAAAHGRFGVVYHEGQPLYFNYDGGASDTIPSGDVLKKLAGCPDNQTHVTVAINLYPGLEVYGLLSGGPFVAPKATLNLAPPPATLASSSGTNATWTPGVDVGVWGQVHFFDRHQKTFFDHSFESHPLPFSLDAACFPVCWKRTTPALCLSSVSNEPCQWCNATGQCFNSQNYICCGPGGLCSSTMYGGTTKCCAGPDTDTCYVNASSRPLKCCAPGNVVAVDDQCCKVKSRHLQHPVLFGCSTNRTCAVGVFPPFGDAHSLCCTQNPSPSKCNVELINGTMVAGKHCWGANTGSRACCITNATTPNLLDCSWSEEKKR